MLNRVVQAWRWFVEGLVEAAVRVMDRAGGAVPLRIEMGEAEAAVVEAGGTRLGRLVTGEGPCAFDPPDLARRLAGSPVDIVIPAAWLMRRDLDPVAVASRPFLDAFVRHQIERITPWRVADTHYRIFERPLPGDANRLAVTVAVVPKRLVAGVVAGLAPLHPRDLRLRSADDGEATAAIPVGDGASRQMAGLRIGLVRGLSAAAVAVVALVGVLQWQIGLVRGDIEDQDRVLAERKAVLVRARRGVDPGGEAAGRLRALRDARPLAVGIIDALSKALPDSAHLTALSIDGDHVTVAGASTEPSALVPALETSGAFADVAFGGATTRIEAGGGDRFSLEMKALPMRSDHARPPRGETAAAAPGTVP